MTGNVVFSDDFRMQIVAFRNRETGATSLSHLDGFSDEKTTATLHAMAVDVLMQRNARSNIEMTRAELDADLECRFESLLENDPTIAKTGAKRT